MSRKDYIAVAAIINDAQVNGHDVAYVAHRLADFFRADNSRFDRDRFLDACGNVEPITRRQSTRRQSTRRQSTRRQSTRRQSVSPAMKRFLSERFPTHAGTSPETEYLKVMGHAARGTVDVTLTHQGNVIHCNDKTGLDTASKYLKSLSL